MAKCPSCAQDCPTPFFLNADAWRWLACPHCAARLERKRPRFLVPLVALWLWPGLIALTRLHGYRFAMFVEVFMTATILVMLVELMHPQLQLRKPLPKAEIRLNINGSSN